MRWSLFLILIPLTIWGCHDQPRRENHSDEKALIKQKKPLQNNGSQPSRPIKATEVPSLKKAPKNDFVSKKKMKTAPEKELEVSVVVQRETGYDSTVLRQVELLRRQTEEIDLNEPLNRNFLLSTMDEDFPVHLIACGKDRILKINFDNDIIDYTDRFYTNGIRIDYTAPVFQKNPLSKLMVPYWSQATNYYGISIVQNMYTPSTTKVGGILYDDRPYAAYLYFGSFKITNDPAHSFRQTGEIDIGIIGPYSFGDWVQTAFHKTVPSNNEPLGWEYQIQNDVILNYQLSFEKGVIKTRALDLNLNAGGSLGTLYTNMTGGFQFRTGWLNPYFVNLGIARKSSLERMHLHKTQCFFFIKGSTKLVGYDATLQGGLFNRTSVYTISTENINRFIFQSSAGISFSHRGIRFDLEQFFLSPEYTTGIWHKWVHFGLSFCL